MKKIYSLAILCIMAACNPSPVKITANADTQAPSAPDIAYSIINAKLDMGNRFYDVYVEDISKIKTLNAYLVEKYKKEDNTGIWINYYNDSVVAKTYFDKQLDENISEKTKDKLFKNYIANYKYNPSTNYDTLVFEH